MFIKYLFISLFFLNQISWVSVASDDGIFSVEIPSTVNWIKTTNTVMSSIGPTDLVIYKSTDKDEYGNDYMVSYMDYEGIDILTDEVKDSLISETIIGLPGELIYQNDIRGTASKGQIIRKKLAEEGLHMKSKIFFEESRLYLMIVYSPEDKSLNSSIEYFLNSFRTGE